MRDESALTVVRSGAPGGRPVVRIFSCAGQLLGSFLWEGGKLAGWGWSSELELVMVDVAGKVSSTLQGWAAGGYCEQLQDGVQWGWSSELELVKVDVTGKVSSRRTGDEH
jgi:hypothetical protein